MEPKEAVIHLRKLGQRYAYTALQLHEAIARKAGFNATDHKYLGFFLQRGALTAGELARLTGLTTGAVTGLIDRFEEKGLVARQSDGRDRRKVVIVPDTRKISDLLRPFYEKFQTESEALLASFSAGELEVLERYFSKAIVLMEATAQNI